MANWKTLAMANPLLTMAGQAIRESRPKQIALSGPAGFLGSRVLGSILDAHDYRRGHATVQLPPSPSQLVAMAAGADADTASHCISNASRNSCGSGCGCGCGAWGLPRHPIPSSSASPHSCGVRA